MDDFKEFASSIVEILINYIYDTSYLDELDLSVEAIDDLQLNGYKCRIINNIETYDNIIWVSIHCDGDRYVVHVSSPYFSTFGLTVLMTSFVIAIPEGDSDVTYLTVKYTAQLNTGIGLTVDSAGVYGTLDEEDSSFQSSITNSGLVTVSRVFDYNLVLGLYKDMLYKSAYCLGRRK